MSRQNSSNTRWPSARRSSGSSLRRWNSAKACTKDHLEAPGNGVRHREIRIERRIAGLRHDRAIEALDGRASVVAAEEAQNHVRLPSDACRPAWPSRIRTGGLARPAEGGKENAVDIGSTKPRECGVALTRHGIDGWARAGDASGWVPRFRLKGNGSGNGVLVYDV